jgi:hypothetical protein
MPNWCENSLSVIGEKEEIKRFYEKGLEISPYKNQGQWSLFPYYPYPGEWDYDWCCENWGTKWDIDFEDYGIAEIEGDAFSACFETAWAPPVEWLKKVQGDYPELKFRLEYSEDGMEFRGVAYTVDINNKAKIVDIELPWVNRYGGKVKFSGIVWDCEAGTELPNEVVIEVGSIDDDFHEEGADLLSEEYGFCVYAFDYEIVHRNEDEL